MEMSVPSLLSDLNRSVQRSTLYLLGEVNVPPEAKFDGVATGAFKAAISESCHSWCAWYHVGIWSLPENGRVWLELVAEEFDFLPHGQVDDKLVLGVEHHSNSLL